jgi:hypothetical protein
MIVRQTWPNQEKLRRFMLNLRGAAAATGPSAQQVTIREQ